jgi:hypothetical protein
MWAAVTGAHANSEGGATTSYCNVAARHPVILLTTVSDHARRVRMVADAFSA